MTDFWNISAQDKINEHKGVDDNLKKWYYIRKYDLSRNRREYGNFKYESVISVLYKKVWDTVTSLDQYEWRSDLSKIEIINEKQFVEYTKDGFATTFTITVSEPCKRWEFDMENSNMKGHWIGIFSEKDGQTEIDFTEDVTAKKFVLKPFVKGFLKK